MKHYLIREPKTEEIHEALIVLYRSFGRLIPTDVDDQANLLNTLIKSKIAKFLIAEKDKKIFPFPQGQDQISLDLHNSKPSNYG